MITPKPVENREFSRSTVSVRSQVRLHSGVLLEGKVCDVSMNGVRFVTERTLPIGSKVQIKLVLDASDNTVVQIDAEGEVARVVDHGVAIQFTCIEEESLQHLRNLVLFNAEDSDRVVQEFDGHIGIHPKKE